MENRKKKYSDGYATKTRTGKTSRGNKGYGEKAYPKFKRSAAGKTTGRNPEYSERRREATPSVDSENVVYGRNPVMELIRSGRTIDKIYVAKGEREGSIVKLIAMAKDRSIPVVEADKAKLEKMTGTSAHQGVMAFTTEFEYCEIEDILALAEERGEKPFILVVDGIKDPGNLGAIIRTAETSGVHGIILPKRNSCGLTATVFKAAAGACEYMKISRQTNITSAIEKLKENNVWVYGMDGGEGSGELYGTDLTGAVAIVLGDEGEGISRLVREHCDYLLRIPMAGNITSLNISAAGAVAMYEVVRQRLGGK